MKSTREGGYVKLGNQSTNVLRQIGGIMRKGKKGRSKRVLCLQCYNDLKRKIENTCSRLKRLLTKSIFLKWT